MFSSDLKKDGLEEDHSLFIEKTKNDPVITGDAPEYEIRNHMDKEMSPSKPRNNQKSILSQAITNVLEPPDGLKEGFVLGSNLLVKTKNEILEPPEGLKEGFEKGTNIIKKRKLGTAVAAAALPFFLLFQQR